MMKAASDAVSRAEVVYHVNPSQTLLMELNRNRAEHIFRTRMEEDFLHKKYVIKWVVKVEHNTKFFQSLVKKKRVRTCINSIHADGRTISNEDEL
ncbi:hypothetical protein ACS0TY_022175 [Phlomoides rotata]